VSRSSAEEWSRDHFDTLLTLAALPVILLTSAPSVRGATGWELMLAVVSWAPLTVRTRWPLPVAAAVVFVNTVDIIVAAHGHPSMATIPIATMLALYTVSLRSTARVAWASALLAAAVQATTALLSRDHHVSQALLYLNWAVITTVIGRLIRERQDRISVAERRADEAERTKAEEVRRQVIDERMRIARELHDVLAHHITVVNAQAGVAQYLLRTDPDAAERTLTGIADNTRAALDELRATLGLLRTDTAHSEVDGRSPAPGLGQLPSLLDSFTNSGTDVTIETTGTTGNLSESVELALYRIIQEALTNATKHAPGTWVQINLQWAETTIVLKVVNPTSPTDPRNTAGSGNGLIGMNERAIAAGGTLTAGPIDDGRYAVTATLPLIASITDRPEPLQAKGQSSPVGRHP
jgi:signal transduction histidine kinase